MPSLRSLGTTFFVALQYREFRRLWGANGSSQAAAWGLIVIQGWLIYDETRSSVWVAAATFATLAPLFLIPPVVGVIADRIDRRRILIWTYASSLLLTTALSIAAIAGFIEAWLLVVFALANGCARAAQMPVSQAMAASLVPTEHLLNALSLNASTRSASRLVGPALVTPLLSVAGATPALLICALFYTAGLVQIRALTPRAPVEVVREGLVSAFVGGLGYVYSRPVLRFMVLLGIFHCGLTMAFESVLPAFARNDLGGGAANFGTLMLGVGIGAFIASILVSGVRTPRARGRTLLAVGLLSGAGQVAFALSTSLGPAIAAAALMGGAQAAYMTMTISITQLLAEDSYRGRVASITTFSLGGMMALVNLVNGSLESIVGAVPLLLWQGGAFMFIVLGSFFVVTGRRVYSPVLVREAGVV